MEKLAQLRDCCICYNNENNTNLTVENSEKILKNCKTYLDISFNNESFGNETQVSCCNYCYETAVELMLLEKQIERLGKDISELSSLFLKTVLERRNNFTKQKKPNFKISNPLIDNECVIVHESSDHLSTVDSKTLLVQKEIDESGSKVCLSDPQGEIEETQDFVTDLGLGANYHGNIIHSPEDHVIEVKFSYDETVSKVVDSDNEQVVEVEPHQEEISGIIAQDCQQTIKTSMSDLLKCLKMPIIQLERLQPCKSTKPTVVVDKTSSSHNSEITEYESCSSLSTNNKYPPNPSENGFPPELTVLPKKQDDSVLIYVQPLNAPIITVEETVNFENSAEENKCSICGEVFLQLCDLEDHVKLHKNVHRYSCSICDKSFLDPSLLKLHENFHTAKRPFNFSLNSKSVRKSARNLRTREIFHSGDTPLKCSVCLKSFNSASILEKHKLLHYQNRPFKCDVCSKLFTSAPLLKKHQIYHFQNKRFKCSFCSKSFMFSTDAKRHEMTHTGERPYKCSICPKAFIISSHLKYHERKHTGQGTYKCSICPKSFIISSHLKYHERKHTGQGTYKCSRCQKSFIISSHLKYHERKHTGQGTYKCSICSKSFETVYDLKRHEIGHTGERPFKCTSCEKAFKLKHHLKLHRERTHGNTTQEFNLPRNLQNHETGHAGEKPYKCSFCPTSFRTALGLKRHGTVHSGDKPYKCSTCSKAFGFPALLKRHKIIHTGEGPYKCSFCSKSFGYVYLLKRHEIIHTGEKPYKCSICEMRFRLTHHLKSHRERRHGNTTEEFILP